jgi:hypothetical protein
LVVLEEDREQKCALWCGRWTGWRGLLGASACRPSNSDGFRTRMLSQRGPSGCPAYDTSRSIYLGLAQSASGPLGELIGESDSGRQRSRQPSDARSVAGICRISGAIATEPDRGRGADNPHNRQNGRGCW